MSIQRKYIDIDRRQRPVKANVTTAHPLDDEEKKMITVELDRRLGLAAWHFAVDPSLISGIKVQYGETVYDGSAARKLAILKERLLDEGNSVQADPQEFFRMADQILKESTPVVVEEVGYVLAAGDGVIQVDGLPGAMLGELVSFPREGLKGMVMNLEENSISCVLLGDERKVQEGDEVRRTGKVVEVPVGRALIGRVVDALGHPLDGKGPILTDRTRPIEAPAPGLADRSPVTQPLQTGIKMIDAMIPIGRGQRELIIGDRQTGKTAIAVDTILNQKGRGVFCVYVGIGQKASTVAQVTDTFKQHGALEYTTVVLAPAGDPAPLQYIAPYAGCAIAEELMYQGQDVLIVYDDLSKHAVAYREMSLLLRRPPGREAYPGDIFYLHARLLERAGKLNEALGGGSMTALPIVQTMAGDISAYIPTNIISITDGQIFLESDLFFAGVRPAVNVGMSVSRVGGDAQIKAMKETSGALKLMLAQYRELASFVQFGAELDASTQAQLASGERLVELLKQSQFSPMEVSDQVVMMFCAARGLLDGIPIDAIRKFEKELLSYMHATATPLLVEISEGASIKAVEERLQSLIGEFKERFVAELAEAKAEAEAEAKSEAEAETEAKAEAKAKAETELE